MEKSGFDCEMLWNEFFAEYDEQGNQTLRKGDFLYCNKEKAAFPYIDLQTRRWQILYVHKSGLVSEVVLSISLTGP